MSVSHTHLRCFCPALGLIVRPPKNIASKAGNSAFAISIMSLPSAFVKSDLSISIHFGIEWIKMVKHQKASPQRLILGVTGMLWFL